MRQQKNTTNNIITWSSNLDKKIIIDQQNQHVFSSTFSSWWFQPHLKNVSQNGNLPQIGMKIKNIWNHHPVFFLREDLHKWNQYNPNREIFPRALSASRPKDITIRITAASSVWGKCWTFDVWNVQKEMIKIMLKQLFFGFFWGGEHKNCFKIHLADIFFGGFFSFCVGSPTGHPFFSLDIQGHRYWGSNLTGSPSKHTMEKHRENLRKYDWMST